MTAFSKSVLVWSHLESSDVKVGVVWAQAALCVLNRTGYSCLQCHRGRCSLKCFTDNALCLHFIFSLLIETKGAADKYSLLWKKNIQLNNGQTMAMTLGLLWGMWQRMGETWWTKESRFCSQRATTLQLQSIVAWESRSYIARSSNFSRNSEIQRFR